MVGKENTTEPLTHLRTIQDLIQQDVSKIEWRNSSVPSRKEYLRTRGLTRKQRLSNIRRGRDLASPSAVCRGILGNQSLCEQVMRKPDDHKSFIAH
jgi:hypothetical protein